MAYVLFSQIKTKLLTTNSTKSSEVGCANFRTFKACIWALDGSKIPGPNSSNCRVWLVNYSIYLLNLTRNYALLDFAKISFQCSTIIFNRSQTHDNNSRIYCVTKMHYSKIIWFFLIRKLQKLLLVSYNFSFTSYLLINRLYWNNNCMLSKTQKCM